MVLCSFRLPAKDRELWQTAAARDEESQSEFLRKAIRHLSRQVLLAEEKLGSLRDKSIGR